jgi:hypothetical protein
MKIFVSYKIFWLRRDRAKIAVPSGGFQPRPHQAPAPAFTARPPALAELQFESRSYGLPRHWLDHLEENHASSLYWFPTSLYKYILRLVSNFLRIKTFTKCIFAHLHSSWGDGEL